MRFYAIGGFNEVGKNMSALEVNNEVVIFEMGVHMERLIGLESEDLEYEKEDNGILTALDVLPDDSILKGKKVMAIVLSHGHLDHVAAVPKLAEKYKCPILGTPYTISVVKRILMDHGKTKLLPSLTVVEYGDVADISKNFQLEFVCMTHSIPQPAMIAVHTPQGTAIIAYDYKLDNTPTLGQRPDYKRIKQLGKDGVKLLLSECVHIADEARTPSEQIAKHMVRDTIERAYEENTAVFVTTFASHIARLNAIIDANKDRRKVILLGRSLGSYTDSARETNLMDFSKFSVEGGSTGVSNMLSLIEKNPAGYLIICTGNQGEYNSVLSRIARKEYKFNLRKEDQVVFSSQVIPSPLNVASRYDLEHRLKSQGVRILKDVHVSGHAMREDHRDLIRMLNPENVIPCHGETERLASYATLAAEEGYIIGDTVRILANGRYADLR